MTENIHRVTLSEVARHFGLSRTAVRDLELKSIIARSAGLDACRAAYLSHLRQRGSTRSAADHQWRTAKGREVELRIAERLNKLVVVEEFDTAVDVVGSMLVRHLGNVPARCTRDLQMREKIRIEIDAARAAIADECERQADALQTTGKAAAVR